jgi:predicted small secreted protein
MKKIALMLVAASVVTLTGCNTMRGFGQDMERAGEAIQRKSAR